MRRKMLMRFPGGLAKALTFSYDDGVEQDERLVSILNKYGMKGTFNLNSGCYAEPGRVWEPGRIHRPLSGDRVYALFRDGVHEVAVHSLTHPYLDELPAAVAAHEVLTDRVNLERQFGRIVRGMAYPMGTYSDETVEVVKSCGIAYARTTKETQDFKIPTDWLRLHPTCRHSHPQLMELAEKFVTTDPEGRKQAKLFFLWGHSYEFERDDNWQLIEDFTAYMAQYADKLWYATNIEICDYVEDYRRMIASADGHLLHNPTARTLWVEYNGRVITIAPGETKNAEEFF